MGFHHLALWISDWEKTKKFYVNCLDMTTRWELEDEDGIWNYYISGPDEFEVQLKEINESRNIKSVDCIAHIAIEVDELDKKFDKVISKFNTKVIKTPATRESRRGNRVRIGLIQDPDGYTIELLERLEKT
jgi:lactoylglutathione lyase